MINAKEAFNNAKGANFTISLIMDSIDEFITVKSQSGEYTADYQLPTKYNKTLTALVVETLKEHPNCFKAKVIEKPDTGNLEIYFIRIDWSDKRNEVS